MKVGSVRVFTTDQNLDRQLEALEIAGGKEDLSRKNVQKKSDRMIGAAKSTSIPTWERYSDCRIFELIRTELQ